MTVSELIAELQKFDPKAPVEVFEAYSASGESLWGEPTIEFQDGEVQIQ